MHTAVAGGPQNQRPGGIVDPLGVGLRHHPVTATALCADVGQIADLVVGHVGDLVDTQWHVLHGTHAVHLGLEGVLLEQHGLVRVAPDRVDRHLDGRLTSTRTIVGQVDLHTFEVCELQKRRAKPSKQIESAGLHAGTGIPVSDIAPPLEGSLLAVGRDQVDRGRGRWAVDNFTGLDLSVTDNKRTLRCPTKLHAR